MQVSSSDAAATAWVNFGKFSVPVTQENGKVDVVRFADALSEGILNRLVRAQIIKGSATKDKGKLVYQLRIDKPPVGAQRPGDAGDGEQGRRDTQGFADDQRVASQEPDGPDQ